MRTRQSHTGTGWSEFLFRLHRAHEELLAALEAVELLTRQLAPDPSLLETARWNVSKASMRRRLLAAEIMAQLRPRIEGADRDELRLLQEAPCPRDRSCQAMDGRGNCCRLGGFL